MSKSDTYQSIVKVSEGFYKEKGSKFMAFAIPCHNEEEAKQHLNQFRKEHPNACHVCFAWRFGTNAQQYKDRFSDDGEPSNSAGKPIFGQIVAYEVTNVLVAVVRYYGGTNLGVGGLINAYKTSAKSAFEQAKIQTFYISDYYLVKFDFSLTGQAMNLLKKFEVDILEQGYEGTKATVTYKVRQSNSQLLLDAFEEQFGFELKYLKTL